MDMIELNALCGRALRHDETVVRDLTMRQLAMLTRLYGRASGTQVHVLARELGVTKPAIVRGADSLTRIGYVTRRRDPHDGRQVYIVATAKGCAYVDTLLTETRERVAA